MCYTRHCFNDKQVDVETVASIRNLVVGYFFHLAVAIVHQGNNKSVGTEVVTQTQADGGKIFFLLKMSPKSKLKYSNPNQNKINNNSRSKITSELHDSMLARPIPPRHSTIPTVIAISCMCRMIMAYIIFQQFIVISKWLSHIMVINKT